MELERWDPELNTTDGVKLKSVKQISADIRVGALKTNKTATGAPQANM